MIERIGTDRARELIATGAVVLEVLGRGEYAKEHLPGGRNIPLSRLGASTVAGIERHAPVVVYCFDFQ